MPLLPPKPEGTSRLLDGTLGFPLQITSNTRTSLAKTAYRLVPCPLQTPTSVARYKAVGLPHEIWDGDCPPPPLTNFRNGQPAHQSSPLEGTMGNPNHYGTQLSGPPERPGGFV
jgi:hypothetical protein